ncbi:hypothetical protein [Mesorhizobium sp. STM 4661]|uniref:hypothetical protein n=1 Tax=Mesorhizobium sp. STM 4661 TaxID=1297570 RepID=UPI0002BE7D22|nr:hypothetical protein [Mesorhizobium sp. STM 4661]CCV11609.1 conserved hypothetical protein [Mesorhizobium sp. STM 4661]
MALIIIQMPGGDTEAVDPTQLLWFRPAFDWEIANTTAIRIGGQRLYSIEKMDKISDRFKQAGQKLGTFTAPAGDIKPVVNARNVLEIEKAKPAINHPGARAVLKFSFREGLAVRETPEDARVILDDALKA